MSKALLLLLCLFFCLSRQQTLNPIMLLPTETTQNVSVDYAFRFTTDTNIPHSASISLTFPFQYDPRQLIKYAGCFFSTGTEALTKTICSVNLRTFTINIGEIQAGTLTILIKNIRNPVEASMSSHFRMRTLFRDVVITENLQFGKLPFTKPSRLVYNYENNLVEQGSTWVFRFTLTGTYPANSTIRFVFPEGFSSNKVQCNITGIVDSTMQTRVFPQANIYDCLNIKSSLSGSQNIILSGIVNPQYEMQMQGLQVQIIQPNNLVILQKVDITNQPAILAKTMNTTITIPNKFRNNTLTYIFEINMDSTLGAGDYLELKFDGNWTFFLPDSRFIEGIDSNITHKAKFQSQYSWPAYSKVFIKNFSQISKQSQTSFYLSLRTPLTSNTYNLKITAFKANGKVAEWYSQNLEINQTTGYIKEMKLHPMNQAVKLPVGQTGPLQITLALRNNLPKTNVLTHGKIVIDITPHIPYPDVNINGVVKCYFYGDIPAKNCTYDLDLAANPTVTKIIAYTPVDFNFQSSEIPFMVTTEGFQTEDDQGLTIDTLVKRYHFHIQFYTDQSPTIPTEVIFTEWVADAIPLTSFSCNEMAIQGFEWSHLKCSFTTPNQILNDGHIHIIRIEFSGSGWANALGYTPQTLYPDYPCLVYGPNILSVPYPKCDLYTYTSNQAYRSDAGVSYINIYGIETIPANSVINMEFPKLQKSNWYNANSLNFSILEDTYGYETHYIGLYSQTINLQTSSFIGSYVPISYTPTTVTVTMTNSVVNKVGDITLTNVDLNTAACDYVILEVDQTHFPDIGRSQQFTCGSHKCSKFNKPIQYFILYPQSPLARYQTLVFPSIKNPAQAGAYTFYLRAYKDYNLQKKISFTVTITPDTLAAPVYTFASYETITQMYPNTNHFYKVEWTLKNILAEKTSYIIVEFVNIFTLSSTYCDLVTSAQPWNGRGIECEVWQGSNKVFITNMKETIVGETFALVVQMTTSQSSASLIPTVSIYTYNDVNDGSKVDQIINSPFTPASITNTNLKTLTSFDFSKSYESLKPIKKGYFGNLILNYDPGLSTANALSVTKMILTFTSQFYPYSNQAGLPLSCKINNQRYPCSYTLAPFEVTITGIGNVLSASSNNVVNITTQYLQRDGIWFPANQGRYLLKGKLYNTFNTLMETSEQYVDIKPEPIKYFNVTYAHRDANLDNIYIAEFQNGNTPITAYNDALNASRIYIGFPRVNSDGTGTVFTSDLGYSNGTVIPCYFETGPDYVAALSGKKLACRLRRSTSTSVPTYVEIINFDSIAAGKKLKVFMGKIKNPVSKIIDMNFNLKINYFNPTTYEQTPQYENQYNLFIDMLDSSISTPTAVDKTSQMFEAGAKVGDPNKFINHVPLTMSGSAFAENDWFIVVMNSEFPLNGVLNNCINNFYKYCIVYPEINWVAIQINNGTLIPFYPQVTQLPLSISRVDTYYQCYTWKQERWTETITYTITASDRWMELQGAITGFNFQVLGSQNKLNIGQKNVDVLVSFTVSHKVPVQGTIEIKFPNDATKVPSIKPHCRSAVSMGSQLYGMKTGKPATNVQGQIGCLVQNSYSWLITSYDELPAGSTVMISGVIDFPTVLTNTLGTGYIVTYSNQHATNVFANGRIIDYLSTNFPLQVENKTWNLVQEVTLMRSQPLRVGHIGKFEFKLQLQDYIRNIASAYTGYIDVNFWKTNILGFSGGFDVPTGNAVCSIYHQTTGEKFACFLESVTTSVSSPYITYRLKFYYQVNIGTPYIISITTQNGDNNQGIKFPTVVGTYKIQTEITYYTNYASPLPTQTSKAHFIEVYGPKFNVLNLVSSVNIPGESNLLLFEIIPSSTITNGDNRLVIEIPTISNDGINLFDQDLGMGYRNYDDLVFDLYDSSITSMKCKVHTGNKFTSQPVKIICNQFSLSSITTAHFIRFGFWVKNPSTTLSLAVPIQVYIQQVRTARKLIWQMLQAGIKVIPTTVSPINDFGNFVCDTGYRQVQNTNFRFTNRNTKPLQTGDYYILKFNFDLRNSDKKTSAFRYPYSGYTNTGDAIFLRNCKTILLKVGAAALANWVSADATQSNKLNVQLANVMYNPAIKLSTSQSQITAYAVYLATQQCQKIIHKDAFPALVPNQPVSPDFTMTGVNLNYLKGQYEDYKFTFRVSNNILTDIGLVKKISIQFPPTSTYDFKFRGQSCIEDPSTTIQIKKCVIDTSSSVIWIDPVQKSTYLNSDYLIFQTVGLAVINPYSNFTSTNNVFLRHFTIKYYTWPDDSSTPLILASSDDYCFMKQDIDQLSSSTSLTYSGSSTVMKPHHDSVQISQQVYVQQFLPSNTDIGTSRARTPIQFKFIAMTSFPSKQGTSFFHSLKMNFGTYYNVPTQTRNNDLYRHFPVCELNGFRILDCTINTGTNEITMNFQQAINANDEVSVRFSVLDPIDSTLDGFILASASNPIITLKVYVTPYGGTSYYFEPQPFNTYYKSSGITYPSMGISSVTLSYGTQVYSTLNYLDFVIQFSRNDVNGLILEIPLVQLDGSIVYSNSKLLGLQSGAEYPCSVGHGMNVFCYYERGQTKSYGKPTRIYISRWAMPASNTLSFRMLFTNPDIVGVYPTFHFKAYGGTIDDSKFMGEQFMGEYRLSNVFKTLSQVSTYYGTSSACYPQPDARLYSTSSNVLFYINNDIAANNYIMLEWTLHDTTYGETTFYKVFNNTNDYDYFIVNYAKNNRKLYIVKKTTTNLNAGSSTYHTFGYLRTKHFLVNDAKMYFFQRPYLTLYTCAVDETWHNNNRDANQYTTAIAYLDLQDRRSNNWGWQFLSIDLGATNPTNMALNSTDIGEMVVVVKWVTNLPYQALSSNTNDCSLQDGLRNTNIMKPITCTIDSANNEIVFKNVNKFTGRYLKFYYYAQTLGSNTWNHQVQTRLYANNDAYVASRWEIFSHTTGYYTMDPVYWGTDSGYSSNTTTAAEAWSRVPQYIFNHDTDNGHVKITYLSSSRIDFQVTKGTTTNFPNNVYKMSFRFHVPRLSFSGGCSVRSEPVSRTRQGCAASGPLLVMNYSYYSTSNTHQWPTWSAGETYSFSFWVTISGQLNADYLFASMAYSWYVSTYYDRTSQCGTCACNLCPETVGLGGATSRYCYYSGIYDNWYCNNGYASYTYYSNVNCRYYQCRWYWQYGGQFISGKSSQLSFWQNTDFVTNYYGDLLSFQNSVETQLMIHFTNFNKAIGPTQQSYLMFQFQGQSFPNGNPFPYTTNSEIAAEIDCKCVLGTTGTISINSGTTYITPKCVRFLSASVDPTVAISLDISVGQDLRCYFPGFYTSSSGNLNIDIFIEQNNYHHTDIPRAIWSRFSQYNQINYGFNSLSTPYGIDFDDWNHTIYENNFWSGAQTTTVRTYQLNFTVDYYEAYPEIYMSMYAPMPVAGLCPSGSFSQCRVYDSFMNRRYFLVAKSTSNYIRTWSLTSASAAFPPSFDASSSFYNTLLYVTRPGDNRYLYSYSNSRSNLNTIISPSTNTYAIQPSMFGSFLETYNSSIVLSVYFNNKKIYAYNRDFGQYKGSFIKVTFSGLTNLKGCGATLRNRPINLDAPFFCQVISNSEINIFALRQLTITDYIYFTVYTAGLPASSTYTVELFDKYMSATNYARSFYITNSFGRSRAGYTTVDPTLVQWRTPVYKQYKVTSGPIRFTFKNNYEYISDYNQTSFSESPFSDAIIVYLPSGISSSDSYICYAKEYLPGKKSLYKRFQVPCAYWNTNKVHIKPLPSYSFKPTFFYEFVIYRHTNTSTMLITLPTSDVFSMEVISSSQLSSEAPVFYDYVDFYKYKNVYPAVLNNIYILTKQAAANNSLFIDFTLNIAGTSSYYFEFQIPNLGLSSFKIQKGEEIPCYLNNEFITIGGKTQSPRCFGYTNGIGTDSPLIIRVFGMAARVTGTNFKLAFDNFNNPAVQNLFLVPIDIMFRYIDRANKRAYKSYWPSVYVSDSINKGSLADIPGSLSRTSNSRGANNRHFISIGWPYNSGGDVSQKTVLKLAGGITCCQSFSSMSLRDNYNTYYLLWQNTKANVSVYQTYSYSIGTARELWITGVNNPHPYQRDTYEKLKKLQILFYNNYKGVHSKKVDQFSFSSYSMINEFSVDASPSLIDSTKSFYFHEQYPMTYRFSFSPSRNQFNNRQLSYTLLIFTSGVTAIDWAHAGWSNSPYYFNSLMQVTYGKNAANQWFVNISGMSDSSYWSTQDWYVEVKFLTSSNTVYYTSETYCLNSELEFTNSQTLSISTATFRTSTDSPTVLELREKKYFKNYFELQRKPIYAKPTSNTAQKLQFRFTTPYSITNQQTITLLVSDTTELNPINSPSSIYCLIRKTITKNLQSGISRWAPCTYTTGKYVITNPIGDLVANTEYTLTILERNQTGTSFKLPILPKRIQVSQIYTSQLNLLYGDVYELDFAGRMNSISWTHASLDKDGLNMIGINFNPQYTLSAASLVSPVTETVLQFQIYAKQFDSCLGVKSIFTTDGKYFASGTYFSHYSSPAVTNANTRLKCGQYSQSFTPIKLTTTDYGQVTASNGYYFRYPLIQNPSGSAGPYVPFLYKFRLLQYKNGAHFPVMIGYYEYEGLDYTKDGNSYGRTGSIGSSNAYVQSTMTLTYSWPSINQGAGSQTWIKWKNNQMEAITDIASFSTITTPNYAYQFYPNVNLLVYIKSNNNDDRTVDLLTFPTNDDVRAFKISWVHLVFTDKEGRYVETNLNQVTSVRTTWNTGTFTHEQAGLRSTSSEGVFKITWKSTILRFVEGSYMILQLINTPFVFMEEFCRTMTGFLPGQTLTNSNLVCRRTSNTEVRIEGYKTVAAGDTLSITVYLKTDTNSVYTESNARVYIQVFSKDDKAIIQGYTSYLSSYAIVQGAQVMKIQSAMRYPFLKDTARSLFLQFRLATNSLGQNQYVEIDFGNWQIDTSTTGKIIASYKVGSNYYYVPAVFTLISGNKYRFGIYKNISIYTIPANTLVTLKIDHINPDNFYGVLVPNIKWNYMKITAHNSGGTVLEHQYAQIWIEPYNHLSLTVQPALDYSAAVSLYEINVTPNVSVAAGDYILLEFTTADGLYSNLFQETLGFSIPTNDSLEISCRETNNAMIISDDNIKCQLFKGKSTVNPSVPATIQIPVQKTIAANQLISFNLLSLKNPIRSNYPIGVTLKLAEICYQEDQNRLCAYYKSTTYISIKPAVVPPTKDLSYGSLTFNPNIVSATPSKHTVSAGVSLQAGDMVKLKYYPEVVVDQFCNLQGANGVCYSYPLQNTIIIKATVAQSGSYSFVLTGMTNLYQYSSSNKLYSEIWQASSRTIIKMFDTPYSVPIITVDPVSTNPLEITFTPTLTPDYQLSYNFDNIAKLELSYMLQNDKIEQILITAPTGIALNSKYCNATLESTASQAKPYPFRFKCEVISSSRVRITKNSDFPAWVPGFINKKIIVYLMYTIDESLKNSNTANWVATTFTDATSTSSDLRVSEGYGNFFVEVYKSPFIYKIDFFTFSFTKRICEAGQKCMFYGYLLPSTPLATYQIKYFDFTIPNEFMYSNLLSYDSCDMKEKNTDSYNFGCSATRNNSKVTVRLLPISYSFNHNYKLLKIDNKDATRLFTAPQYPGSHYQMKVDLYTTTNLLIESQYVNLTSVYGKLLSWNDIVVTIPQDASTVGIFEFTFKVGAVDVEPAYESSEINRIVSAIQIIFSNSFDFDLGTGKTTGEQVACLPILNLNLKTMGRLTCKIYPSYSTITNPTIIVTGYDKILKGSTVTFTIAGLKSLPVDVTDYVKIGVSYKYYYYGNVKGYIYEPTGKVVGPVTAPNTVKNIAVTVTQTSTNFVGELVNYAFSCTFDAGFATVKPTDYIGIEFPKYGFEGRFGLNPSAKCSPATSQKCFSFGVANIIYFKPATAISSTSLSFSLTDNINTAFSFDYKDMPIRIFTVIDGKIDSSGSGSLIKFSKPSTNISGLITKTDSIYGGQSGISYYMDFKLGSYLPEFGKISITFPSVYGSLFDLSVSCKLNDYSQNLLGEAAYCQIVNSNQMIIAPNGILMDKDTTYTVIVYNLTNPNANISSNLFTIQSFYSDDIYNKQIISQNTFSPPEINVISVKSCQFDLTVQTTNQNYKSFYSMSFICPSVIKQASRLQIFLPWNLTQTGKQLCTSQSSSLYSYQCSIKNDYINNVLVSFMEVYLREHVPQKLIQIKGQITNGVKGSYQLTSSISYKNFIYLTGQSNKIYIDDQIVKNLSKMQIIVQNYPYNRNYESLYTFKMTNPKISANSLRIQIPSTILPGPNGITCNSEQSSTNKDYFSFLSLLNTTKLDCSMSGQSILINGLVGVMSGLKDDEFLFIDVFGLKNPDVSVNSSTFKFTFLNLTESTGNAIGTITELLPYRVSQSPLNMQMNSISLTSLKLQVLTNYSIISSTIASTLINLTAQSDIGVKIKFPAEYSSTWPITQKPSSVKIYFGNNLYTSTNIYMAEGQLMARVIINSYESFSSLKVEFVFRNANQTINCTASNFIVSLFDFRLNSILAQTVGNNAGCIKLSDKLFWIKVSGNSQIRSGNFSIYTVELQKPAKYLKIRPVTTTSAISFSPSEIIFQNYTSTLQEFKIISSPGFTGSFLISFTKQEMASNIFYNDIKNETITLVAPISPYMINFQQTVAKSVGEFIESYIHIQVPSPITFGLLHSNNCSQNYEITPANRINIPAGAAQVAFAIKYRGETVPQMCQIKFEISSLTNINYALATNVLYLSGQPSIDRTNTLRPMILRITKQPRESKDIGTSILRSDEKSKLKPTIYELKDKNIQSNQIQLQVYVSQPGFIYYAAMQVGTQQEKVTQNMIYDEKITTGVVYNKTRVTMSKIGNVNIVTDLSLSGLEADKRYLIGVYLNSTVGISDVKFKEVQTQKSSNGAVIKICFNSIELNSTVLETLSTILRIKTDRLSVFTMQMILLNISTSHSNQVMNSRRYVYEVVLAPNRFDDSIKPLDSFTSLISSRDLQTKVKQIIPSFDLTYSMTAHELILAKPKIRGNGISVQQLTDHKVKVSIQFWQVAYVYGVIVIKDTSKPALLTKQIIDGLNRQNQRVDFTHRVSTQTDSQGFALLQFRLLQEETQYEIFVTAECVLPYTPRAQLSDAEVLKQTITTSTNLNVANNGPKIIEQLKAIKNDQLAQAVREHILSVQQKKVLNEKVTRIRNRK